MCVHIFRNFNKLSYFRIQQIKLSFIHIPILILQNVSSFLICESFNIIYITPCVKCGFTDASRAKIRIFTPRDMKFRTILVRKTFS